MCELLCASINKSKIFSMLWGVEKITPQHAEDLGLDTVSESSFGPPFETAFREFSSFDCCARILEI